MQNPPAIRIGGHAHASRNYQYTLQDLDLTELQTSVRLS